MKTKRIVQGSPLTHIFKYLNFNKSKVKCFKNLEMLEEYNCCLVGSEQVAGVSAMLRVKNEEKSIQACVESIIDLFDEVVIIDNASSDSTLEIVKSLMSEKRYAEKIKLFSYPHRVSRCGQEHYETSANSVHSLAYYYNWSLSRCSYSVVCKWDADMVLSSSAESRARFKKFLDDSVSRNGWMLGEFQVQTVYIDDEGVSYIARDDINSEVRIFPHSPSVYFKKGDLWEELKSESYIPRRYLSDVCVYEIKDVDDDEYSHWTDVSFKGDRKVREYRNYIRVKNNWHKPDSSDFIPAADL
jgi:glycosyltransferase involved in cell wall biosynthesis